MNQVQPSSSGVTGDGVDVAIVTALPVERDAVLQHLDRYERVDQPGEPYPYYKGQIDIPGTSSSYEVVVTKLIDPGNLEAGIETAALIARWRPKYVFMVGIAGGLAEKGVNRGDVVIARYVHYYEPGKRTIKGEQRRPKQFYPDRVLYSKATNYDITTWQDDVGVPPPVGADGHIPRAHFGPIASGEQVITDPETVKQLLLECPQMLAVAMEAAGVGQAVENTKLSFIEIRGVSDPADPSKDDSWHDYAANAAAAFTRGFLRSHPVFSMAEEEQTRADPVGHAVPLVILRAQSLRVIHPDELLRSLPPKLRERERETVLLDFTDLVASDRSLTDPEEAVRRLVSPDGGLMRAMARRGEVDFVFHGLVHIPLAILAGYLVTDRQPVEVFELHSSADEVTWGWPDDGHSFPMLTVNGLPGQINESTGEGVLRVSVSYRVTPRQTAAVVPTPFLAVDIAAPAPERNIVRSDKQLRTYGRTFRHAIDRIAERAPGLQHLSLFYAGPVSLGFHLGKQISENIHPPVIAWNYRRGYDWAIDLAAASLGEGCIVRPSPRA
jgi:nucleoside phosphorylase